MTLPLLHIFLGSRSDCFDECITKSFWKIAFCFIFLNVFSNTTSGVFTDVRAVLQFEPTRFYNNEVFECLVEHPALETVDSFKMITVNVTCEYSMISESYSFKRAVGIV